MMALHEIAEYKLDITPGGELIHPPWVDRVTPHFGILYNPTSKTYIGFILAAPERAYKIPDTVRRLSRAELKTRAWALQQTMGGPPWLFPDPDNPYGETPLGQAGVEALMDDLCDLHKVAP